MARTVILDTNALLMPFQFRINLETELERLLGSFRILIPGTVWRELDGLRRRDRLAKAALALAKRYEVVDSGLKGDEAIIELAAKEKGVVVTNDRDLIKKLRRSRIPVIYMRSSSHLVLEGEF